MYLHLTPLILLNINLLSGLILVMNQQIFKSKPLLMKTLKEQRLTLTLPDSTVDVKQNWTPDPKTKEFLWELLPLNVCSLSVLRTVVAPSRPAPKFQPRPHALRNDYFSNTIFDRSNYVWWSCSLWFYDIPFLMVVYCDMFFFGGRCSTARCHWGITHPVLWLADGAYVSAILVSSLAMYIMYS